MNKYEIGQIFRICYNEFNFIGIITKLKEDRAYYKVLYGIVPTMSLRYSDQFTFRSLWGTEKVQILGKDLNLETIKILYGPFEDET